MSNTKGYNGSLIGSQIYCHKEEKQNNLKQYLQLVQIVFRLENFKQKNQLLINCTNVAIAIDWAEK